MRASPTPPADCPPEVSDQLTEYDPEQLRAIAEYADALADDRAAQREDESDDEDEVDVDEDLPEDVPSKATVVVKTINDNRYYYRQWREGDQIKSKYKNPVDPDE